MFLHVPPTIPKHARRPSWEPQGEALHGTMLNDAQRCAHNPPDKCVRTCADNARVVTIGMMILLSRRGKWDISSCLRTTDTGSCEGRKRNVLHTTLKHLNWPQTLLPIAVYGSKSKGERFFAPKATVMCLWSLEPDTHVHTDHAHRQSARVRTS